MPLIVSRRRDNDMFIFVGLGLDNNQNKKFVDQTCEQGYIYFKTSDNNKAALLTALQNYYLYMTVGRARYA